MNNKFEIKKQFQNYIDAGVHYGLFKNKWNPKMAPYILKNAKQYHIFDLVTFHKRLKIVSQFLQTKVQENCKILFVGTTKESSELVKEYALKTNSFYINYRWLGGMLTNWTTFQNRIQRLKKLKEYEHSSAHENLSKKAQQETHKEIKKLERYFEGIQDMLSLPDIVIFMNQSKEYSAIQECRKLGISIISIINTNENSTISPYLLSANTESKYSLEFILNYLTTKILVAKTKKSN